MALIPCPTCERQVSQLAVACPGCGHPIATTSDVPPAASKTEPSGTPTWVVVLGIILGSLAALLFVGYLLGSTPEAKEEAADRAAIEICENDIKKQSYGSGEAIIVRGACDILRKQFVHKHGRSP